MELSLALSTLEDYLKLDGLNLYAPLDNLGGYHDAPDLRQWPVGSLWEGEGRTLYALVRAFQPFHILELGVHVGASTSHLRLAVKHNGQGYVHSVDRWGGAGALIPDTLTEGVIHYEDAFDYIETIPNGKLDMVFEDLCHHDEEVERILRALKPKLTRKALIVHHDSEHGSEGEAVRTGIRNAGIKNFMSLCCGDTDCGLAVYWWGSA